MAFNGKHVNMLMISGPIMHQHHLSQQVNDSTLALSQACGILVLGIAIVISNVIIIATYINYRGPTEVVTIYLLSLATADLLCGLLIVPLSVYPAVSIVFTFHV
jgi:dopamine/ecdysteroid receptor